MRFWLPLVLVAVAARCASGAAVEPCPPTPIYEPCELVYEMTAADAATHPDPYRSVDFRAEFRSPRARTVLVRGFWDGGRRLVVRFAPLEPGEWTYRITSNLPSLPELRGSFTAAASSTDGFIQARNVHHWSYTENHKPHLWAGDTCYGCLSLNDRDFETYLEERAAQGFNHVRLYLTGSPPGWERAFSSSGEPVAEWFQRADRRIRALNRRGIVADLILAPPGGELARRFRTREDRARYLTYVAARYAAMNVTWQLCEEYESYPNARAQMAELGGLLKQLDPYGHPRTAHARQSSSPLYADGWMDHILQSGSDAQLGSIEHQLFAAPMIAAPFAYEQGGSGNSHPLATDAGEIRRRLWRATMNGQYPVYGHLSAGASEEGSFDVAALRSEGARAVTLWRKFFEQTRFWELEPYYDVFGGRAVALPGIEYVVYVESGETVEMLVVPHRYSARWFNPSTGEFTKMREDFRGERFAMAPPSKDQDWVLHLSREGTKQSMARSVIFESRPILMQEVEVAPQRTPFEIARPASEELRAGQPVEFEIRITRESPGTRRMMYLWTGEAPSGSEGYRVLATGDKGFFRIPVDILPPLPTVFHLRVTALNAFGKAYQVDKVYRVIP